MGKSVRWFAGNNSVFKFAKTGRRAECAGCKTITVGAFKHQKHPQIVVQCCPTCRESEVIDPYLDQAEIAAFTPKVAEVAAPIFSGPRRARVYDVQTSVPAPLARLEDVAALTFSPVNVEPVEVPNFETQVMEILTEKPAGKGGKKGSKRTKKVQA